MEGAAILPCLTRPSAALRSLAWLARADIPVSSTIYRSVPGRQEFFKLCKLIAAQKTESINAGLLLVILENLNHLASLAKPARLRQPPSLAQ